MSSSGTKSVNAVHTGKPYRKGQSKQTQRKPQNGSDCGNCTKKHKSGCANCPAHESICNKCGHTGHWQVKCRGGAPPHRQSDKTKSTRRHRQQGKKGRTDLVDLDEYDNQYDEIDLHTVNDDLEEIKVDDMVEPQKTEAYTIVHLPTSNNGKTNASVRVKADTGAGGNIMPLRVFKRLHPKKMDWNGNPIDLEASKTQLTAYNGTPIPQYGALSCPLTWRPGNGKKPRRIQSKWYVADTPGPAILGLPACESLQVITLNCAV